MRPRMKLVLVSAAFGAAFAVAQSKLPETPVRVVTEEYFGTTVTDPYRWLESTSTPEVTA
jgi:prolyl oligopeptidase